MPAGPAVEARNRLPPPAASTCMGLFEHGTTPAEDVGHPACEREVSGEMIGQIPTTGP